jgi:hypothetical protein
MNLPDIRRVVTADDAKGRSREALLRTGDVLIQRGTNHAWANRSSATARIAFVLIDGTR